MVQLVFYLMGPLQLEDGQSGKWIKSAVVIAAVGAVALVVRRIRGRHAAG